MATVIGAIRCGGAGGDGDLAAYSAAINAFHAKAHDKIRASTDDFAPWLSITRMACQRTLWKYGVQFMHHDNWNY